MNFYLSVWIFFMAFFSCSGMFSPNKEESASKQATLLIRLGEENKDKKCNEFPLCTEVCDSMFESKSVQKDCKLNNTVGEVSGMEQFFNYFVAYQFQSLKNIDSKVVKNYFSLEMLNFKKAIENLDYDSSGACLALSSLVRWIIADEEVASAINEKDGESTILKLVIERLQHACVEEDEGIVFSISGGEGGSTSSKNGGNSYKACVTDFNFKNQIISNESNFRLSCSDNDIHLQACYEGSDCSSGGTGFSKLAPVQHKSIFIALSVYYEAQSFGYFVNTIKEQKVEAFKMGHKLIKASCSKEEASLEKCIKGFYCWIKRSGKDSEIEEMDMNFVNEEIGDLFEDPSSENVCGRGSVEA